MLTPLSSCLRKLSLFTHNCSHFLPCAERSMPQQQRLLRTACALPATSARSGQVPATRRISMTMGPSGNRQQMQQPAHSRPLHARLALHTLWPPRQRRIARARLAALGTTPLPLRPRHSAVMEPRPPRHVFYQVCGHLDRAVPSSRQHVDQEHTILHLRPQQQIAHAHHVPRARLY